MSSFSQRILRLLYSASIATTPISKRLKRRRKFPKSNSDLSAREISPSKTAADFRRRIHVLSALLPFLLLVWAAANWSTTVFHIIRNYNALPFEDYWRVPFSLPRYKAFDLRVLWHPHNEHRIIFPEIVFAFDILFAHGLQILPLCVSFLCYLGTLATLAVALIREKRVSLDVRLSAVLLSAVIVGWYGSALVLSQAFLLQWTLTQLAVALALVFLARTAASRSNKLRASIMAAVVATYSSGNGMLLWPLLLLAAFVLHLNKRQIAAILISSVLAVGTYFVGYHEASEMNLRNFISHPLYTAEFVGAYVGMPFGGMKGPSFGVYVGFASITLMALLFVIAIRKNLLRSDLGILIFGTYGFTLLTAILTAAGRMSVTDSHYSGAEASRYITLPLVNWAVFISASIWTSSRSRWGEQGARIITVVISLLLLVGLPKLRWWLRDNQSQFISGQLVALSIESGLQDPSFLAKIFPDPSPFKYVLPQLRADRLSVYYNGRREWIGEPAGSFAPVLQRSTEGSVTYTYPIQDGLQIAGHSSEPGWLLLVNESQQIIGFGNHLPAGFPQTLPAPSRNTASNWVGFANLSVPTKAVSAYSITPAGLLAVGRPINVPPIRALSEGEMGKTIGGITWRADSGALSAALPPLKIVNPPGAFYSTWYGDDSHQGQIDSSEFPLPANGCLVLPVLTGPSVAGLSVEIINASTGRQIGAAPLQNDTAWWAFWQFRFDPGIKTIRISAQDHGSGWGQWLAIAQPHECR